VPIENSLSFLGLQTSPNNLGAGERGALVVADNVTIRYPDVLEPRRGQAVAPIALEDPAAVEQVFFFGDNVFVHTAADKVQRQDALVALTGDYVAADPDYRLKTAIAAQTLYMATDKGVMALEEATLNVPRLSGIAEPLKPVTAVVLDTGSTVIPGFLLPEKAVAYRILFGYVDSHGALHLGPPSVKFTVKNVSTTTQASVRLAIPLLTAPTDVIGAIVEGTFVRLYRSVMADTEGATSDELYLVNETVIDTTAYTTTSVDFEIADTARQDFAVQSAPLYTNATQGFLPNDPPPFARDIATWSEREWYANTEQPFSLTAQLIGVEGGGTPDVPATGIRIGDTVTVAGVVFTGAAAENVSTNSFLIDTSGGPEVNISGTLESLARIVNARAILTSSFKIRAYLEPVVFGTDQLNFKIRFQRPSVDSTVNTAFGVDYSVQQFTGVVVAAKVAGEQTVTTLVANQWKIDDFVQFRSTNPTLPRITALVTAVVSPTVVRVTPVTVDVPTGYTRAQRLYGESVWTPDLSAGVAADNERRQNGLYYSLPDEPEAVSAANYLTVGTSGKPIRRIIPQRDRLLVFKDEGTYAVYGDFPYQVQLIDDTVAILAPDSATAIGSTVIVLTDDGIMAVSDGGIRMISRPIDSTLKPYITATYRATTITGAFGVAYESEKVFALFMPGLAGAGASYTAKAYVLGLETEAWTTWSFYEPRLCGRVDPFSDTAYYGIATSPYLFKDRNTSSTADYFDTVPVGVQGIDSTVQWAATTLGAPYATKQAREIHFHFRDLRQPPAATLPGALFSIKTDIVPLGQEVEAWGVSEAATFSTEPIIGGPELPRQFRKLVPQEVQRATYYTLGMSMTTSFPGGYWALNGYSIVFEGTSERTGTVR